MLLGIVCLLATISVRSQVHNVVRNIAAERQANDEILVDMTNAETGVRGYLISRNQSFLAPYDTGTAALPARFATVEQHLPGDPRLRGRLAAERAEVSAWYRDYARPVIAGATPDPADGKRLFDAFRASQAAVADMLDRHREAKIDELNRTQVGTLALVAGCLVIGLVVGTRTAVVTTRRLVRPLTAVTEAVRSLAHGRLVTRPMPAGPAEVQEVGWSVNVLADQLDRVADERASAAARLQKANDELEAFSYSVSHDLRAPLRAVTGFSHILVEQHADEMSEQARELLNRVERGGQRMGALIDDLLAFAHVGRQELTKTTVHPADIARECLADLSAEQEGRHVETLVEDLPACLADPALLKLVYTNLLSNALKYSRGRDPAHIRIGSHAESGATVYFVSDNGAGFDSRYAHKLFGVFQRLHKSEQFEGTGVGLALAARIIKRHGGQIWADGKIDQGATISFTLPVAAPS